MANTLQHDRQAADRLIWLLDGEPAGRARGLAWNAAKLAFEPDRKQSGAGAWIGTAARLGVDVREVFPAWNLDIDERRAGYTVDLRAGEGGRKWGRWHRVARMGKCPAREGAPRKGRRGATRVMTDFLYVAARADSVQVRVQVFGPPAAVRLRRVSIAVTGTPRGRTRTAATLPPARRLPAQVRMEFPVRDQRTARPQRIAGEICCPTSLSMVLAGWGHRVTMERLAALARDPHHGIYGNWPLAVQAASQFGHRGWIERFRSHDEVRARLAAGTPVVASIRAEPGDLPRARYQRTRGHLILVCGYDRKGYWVNDPDSPGPGGGPIHYSNDEVKKVWLDKSGIGLVLEPQ